MTRVKVCGLTRAEDVRLAVELGAWAVGFVLAASPRHIVPAKARELAGAAGDALTVGVFTTQTPAWIAAAVATAGLGAVQLSAGADGPTVAEIREACAQTDCHPLVIAAAGTPDVDLADFVLLDAKTPGVYGGTGRRLDWELLADDPATPRKDLILAGGLKPAGVASAIAALHPVAVDVSSGVEWVPGIKDAPRLRDFFTAVERADQNTTDQLGKEVADRTAVEEATDSGGDAE
jgi:phosphoribosylanthranilate isomerase